ncbi:MAG TPA: SDR family oxidoreductase [Phototrophicaceae bacterium]|nr:SDR family oxidoreductase [Phototrophicaceae bacterium]
MNPTTRPTALITGASSGIGYELAWVLAREGHDLVLVARSENRLNELARDIQAKHQVCVKVLPQDLAQPSAPPAIFEQVRRDGLTIEVLVNNAGFGNYGPFWETDTQTELDELQVNMVALTHLTKLFLPGMRARGRGKIMNVASTGAFQPGPLMAVYCASKAYVLSFSEALATELQGSGVTVTTLCPGLTESRFHQNAEMDKGVRILHGSWMTSKQVAEMGYRALVRGQMTIVTGWQNRLLALTPRLLPRGLTTRVVLNMMARDAR